MYKPAPPRQKQTSITRARSGCKDCRKRRVKCDEKKPSCGACLRRNKVCEAWEPGFHFRNASLSKEVSNSSGGSAKPRKVIWQEPFVKHPRTRSPGRAEEETPQAERAIKNGHTTLVGAGSAESLHRHSSPPLLSPAPALSSFYISRSLNSTENEMFYLTHWDVSCLGALDTFFQDVTIENDECLPLKHAILALSACNMSRRCPEQSSYLQSVGSHTPNRNHQITSQFYYTSAVGQVAKVIRTLTPQSSIQTLAVLVIFCYIESTMGTFPGFACHADGIATLFHTNQAALTTNTGRHLFAAYILSKQQNWWRRQNFTSLCLQRNQPSLSLQADTLEILRSVDAKRTMVTSILCESYRLNTMGLLQLWDDLRQGIDPSVENFVLLLDLESKRLDEWESNLSPRELPRESSRSFDIRGKGRHRALLFESHSAAMNYAYYIAARIMHGLEPHPGTECITLHWMTTLVQIVDGLDEKSCAQKNVYSIGISSLLMACVLRCRDIHIGQWVEDWLRNLSRCSILEEGSFPVAQALAAVVLINTERSHGNEVYAIGLPEDDGGGSGKYSSYHSQSPDKILIQGIRKETGEPFSEYRYLEANT